MPASCRCPRCAYPLTGLPGAPEHPYAPFRAEVRCPECALEVPVGAHCLVGGASPDVVDPSGSRGVAAIVLGAVILIGGPWLFILGSVFLVEFLRSSSTKRGIGLSTLQAWGIAALPVAVGVAAVLWFVWSRWRQAEVGSIIGDRAGARRRRAMVVPGGVHLWSGEPSAAALPRSFAGGDIRDVRGRRHVPLFRKKGAAEVGAIDLITPIILWSMQDAKQSSNITDGRFAGTIWLLMPTGVAAANLAQMIERSLRMAAPAAPATPAAPAAPATPAAPAAPAASAAPIDPNRLVVPPAITAGTPSAPPICPRCSARLGDETPGFWWEPLTVAITCPTCQLRVEPGAIVVTGWRGRSDAARLNNPWIVFVTGLGLVVIFAAAAVVAILSSKGLISTLWTTGFQIVCFAAIPIALVRIGRKLYQPIRRPRTRFQSGNATWIVDRGRVRIVHRGKVTAPIVTIERPSPGGGSLRFSFGQQFAPENSGPLQTDTLTVRGTAPQLGLSGELRIHLPIPAEVDPDTIVSALTQAFH